ncbi:MAG: glycosyltransferase family 39 protein [Nitrospinae bacterium]|nr:glycosyltransferase family 39 protein [Nitrospinota bacterium]
MVLLPRFLQIFLLALFASLAVSSMAQKSPTWDETHYLGIGVYLAKERSWDVPSAHLHPPLSFYLNSLPFLFLRPDFSCFEKGPTGDYFSAVKRGNCLMEKSGLKEDHLLFYSRLPMVFIGALLGCYVFIWATELYGAGGGLFSLFLFCLCPNMLAHTQLITPDICLTAFGFIGFYYCWSGIKTYSKGKAALAGLFLGLALLSKYSALLWFPVFLAATACLHLKGSNVGKIKASALFLGIILLVSIFIFLFGYLFHAGEFFYGINLQHSLVSRGEPAFMKGEVSHSGWLCYYLFAFLIKVPVPMLVFLLMRCFLFKWVKGPKWVDTAFLLLPVISFLGIFSLLKTVNIGLRYILPVFPFLMVWAGGLAALNIYKKAYKRILNLFITVGLLFYGASGLSIHPHYLAYFNEIIGGPENGYKYLVDSNLDWGQDLKGVRDYMVKNGIKEIKLSYFGTVDPILYGINYRAFPGNIVLDKKRLSGEIVKGEIVGISATNLYPVHANLEKVAEHFRNKKPLAVIGHSIFLYKSDIAALMSFPEK